MKSHHEALRTITRRHFFKESGVGVGALALSALLNEKMFAFDAPKAKSIIYLFMAGAPSQLDLFDPKPKLQQYDGQEIPEEFVPKGERFAFITGTPRLLGSPFAFDRHGQSGTELSSLMPHLSKAVVRPRQRKQGSPGIRGAPLRRAESGRRKVVLGQRVSADGSSRSGIPFGRRSSALRVGSARRRSTGTAGIA